LACAWLVAADRTSIAQIQATRVVQRDPVRPPRRYGDGSIGRTCIATSLDCLLDLPQNRPANESRMPRNGTLREEWLKLAELCSRPTFSSTEIFSPESRLSAVG
jgi:hypothetical protein